MQLKLASALCKEPNLLVLSPLFDMLDPQMLARVTDDLAKTGSSIIYFSFRNTDIGNDHYLWLGKQKQIITTSQTEFLQHAQNVENEGLAIASAQRKDTTAHHGATD
jgi:putative ABC transport system ATP-binding protein